MSFKDTECHVMTPYLISSQKYCIKICIVYQKKRQRQLKLLKEVRKKIILKQMKKLTLLMLLVLAIFTNTKAQTDPCGCITTTTKLTYWYYCGTDCNGEDRKYFPQTPKTYTLFPNPYSQPLRLASLHPNLCG